MILVSEVLCHPTESEVAREDVLQMFLKDRQLNGDFISKVSDFLWSKENIEFAELETNTLKEDNQYHEEVRYLILLDFFYCGVSFVSYAAAYSFVKNIDGLRSFIFL